MRPVSNNINIKNKRASFDYEFIDTDTAGDKVNPAGKGQLGGYFLLLL